MLFTHLIMTEYVHEKQLEARRVAQQYRMQQMFLQQQPKPTRCRKVMAKLGRFLITIGTTLEALYPSATQPRGNSYAQGAEAAQGLHPPMG